MKYFTIQWWSGEIDDQEAAFAEYASYLANSKERLPSDLQRLLDEISLHDSRLRRLVMKPEDQSIRIELDGCGYDEGQPPYAALKIVMEYGGVSCFESLADPDQGLGGPHGYGDLGYDEIEILDSTRFQHRMLFSSGIEFSVTFQNFKLYHEKIPVSDDEEPNP